MVRAGTGPLCQPEDTWGRSPRVHKGLGWTKRDGRSGTLSGGRLNAYNSLEDDTTPPGTIGDLAAPAWTALTVSLSWTATGDDGVITFDLNLVLSAYTAAPPAASLLSPSAGATNVPTDVTFSWSPAAQAASYELEVATDSGFTPVRSIRLSPAGDLAALLHDAANVGTCVAPPAVMFWQATERGPGMLGDWLTTRTLAVDALLDKRLDSMFWGLLVSLFLVLGLVRSEFRVVPAAWVGIAIFAHWVRTAWILCGGSNRTFRSATCGSSIGCPMRLIRQHCASMAPGTLSTTACEILPAAML